VDPHPTAANPGTSKRERLGFIGVRRLPSAAEQTRRVAWGHWIGQENKRRYEDKMREADG